MHIDKQIGNERFETPQHVRFVRASELTMRCFFSALPPKDLEDQTRREKGQMNFDYLAGHTQMRYLDYSTDNVRRYGRYQAFLARQYDQRQVA